jgi:hypothetical protein
MLEINPNIKMDKGIPPEFIQLPPSELEDTLKTRNEIVDSRRKPELRYADIGIGDGQLTRRMTRDPLVLSSLGTIPGTVVVHDPYFHNDSGSFIGHRSRWGVFLEREIFIPVGIKEIKKGPLK